MRRFNKNLGLPEALSRATRQKFDFTYGGHRSQRFGLADSLTQSLANNLIAPENNRPGREFLRRGWGDNYAGVITQEGTNDLVRTRQQRRRDKRV
jgi:hypothetical protein